MRGLRSVNSQNNLHSPADCRVPLRCCWTTALRQKKTQQTRERTQAVISKGLRAAFFYARVPKRILRSSTLLTPSIVILLYYGILTPQLVWGSEKKLLFYTHTRERGSNKAPCNEKVYKKELLLLPRAC